TEPGEQLTEEKTGGLGGRRPEFTADFRRGARLHVPGIQVRRPAEEVDQDTGFCPRPVETWSGGWLLVIGPQEVRQRQAKRAEAAHLKKVPARRHKAAAQISATRRRFHWHSLEKGS